MAVSHGPSLDTIVSLALELVDNETQPTPVYTMKCRCIANFMNYSKVARLVINSGWNVTKAKHSKLLDGLTKADSQFSVQ